MTTKTDTPAVPAWALEAAREITEADFSNTGRNSIDGAPLDFVQANVEERNAAIIACHAAQGLQPITALALAKVQEERDRLAAANAELLEALLRIGANAVAVGMPYTQLSDIAKEAASAVDKHQKHTPKEGAHQAEQYAGLMLDAGIYRCPECKMPLSWTPECHLPDCSIRAAAEQNLRSNGWVPPTEPAEETTPGQ